jgi:hypothetical protein
LFQQDQRARMQRAAKPFAMGETARRVPRGVDRAIHGNVRARAVAGSLARQREQ